MRITRQAPLFPILACLLIAASCSPAPILEPALEALAEACREDTFYAERLDDRESTVPLCLGRDCTLREAFYMANICGGAKTVRLLEDAHYILNRRDRPTNLNRGPNLLQPVSNEVTVFGNGSRIEVADGAEGRIFIIEENGSLSLEHITLQGGSATSNTFPSGGQILNLGSLRIVTSTLRGGLATDQGGAIYNDGQMALSTSTIVGATAREGAAVFSAAGPASRVSLSIQRAALVENGIIFETHYGGGLHNRSQRAFVSDSTFSANAASIGSGIYNHPDGSLELVDVTITENLRGVVINTGDPYYPTPAQGIHNSGTAQITNSIIGGNIGLNCETPGSAFARLIGTNLTDDSSCPGFTVVDDLALEPLTPTAEPPHNLSPPPFHLPAQGSPAVNSGGTDCIGGADQRSQPSPNGACDVGAIER